jgi:hypothetical protein
MVSAIPVIREQPIIVRVGERDIYEVVDRRASLMQAISPKASWNT